MGKRQAGRQADKRHHERVWRKDSSKWRCGGVRTFCPKAARLIDRQVFGREQRGRVSMCDMHARREAMECLDKASKRLNKQVGK